ncbi:MAG: hypothetical protein Q8Q90_01980 [bacterium]|nr:hypothetical protein [bacterium]
MLVPIIIGLVGLTTSRGRITLKEFFAQQGVLLVVVLIGYFISRWTSTRDVEVWSGEIVKKEKDKVSCSHSYPCNPHSCNCDKNGCDTCWDTCYDHNYDWDWNIFTSNKEDGVINIERIDSQGNKEPPRWTQAKIGDPTAQTHSFTNYIKANPGSILRRTGAAELYKGYIPKYPNQIYDYYYCDRFLVVGDIGIPDIKEWNRQLSEINAELGAKKKMNIVAVAVALNEPEYAYALEEVWIGGKKNDLIIVMGIPNYPKIEWVSIFSWSIAEDLKVELRDAIIKIGTMERREEIGKIIYQMTDDKFIHRDMDDFKYLMAGVQPGTTGTIIMFILGTLLSVGMTFYFRACDPFGDRYN